MVVGVCYLELYDDTARSLKDKRRQLKSLKERLKNNFNICVIEVDYQDLWQRSRLAVITGGDRGSVDRTLNHVINFVRKERNFTLLNYDFERR
ncbi:DUF503 domain-containing protein [candidate division WOR-3 bacterium]|uniref:DUF503 domain-containing protein n=1 Tax=candidate division WOR-3 bacterium TaxID=2052148 RepID=A0A660SKW5_UNCW3|nr:MAG: DUF503 domain-containing protein [candidate division WOR-3 bacterium]